MAPVSVANIFRGILASSRSSSILPSQWILLLFSLFSLSVNEDIVVLKTE